jgi:hypothetical protein
MRKFDIPKPGRIGCNGAIIARVSQIILDRTEDLKGADHYNQSG